MPRMVCPIWDSRLPCEHDTWEGEGRGGEGKGGEEGQQLHRQLRLETIS